MRKITIAIDGYSSTGKSTVAKQLAQKLGYIYIDTGAMYRAVTLYALEHRIVDEEQQNIPVLIKVLPYIQLTFKHTQNADHAQMYLNNKNVEEEIRSMAVSQYVSKVATVSQVRQKLVAIQRKLGKAGGVVMDGRDIGTVVFPDAELKLFLTADTEVRAQRRYKELLDKGYKVTYKEVLHNIQERDHMDSHRENAPLQSAADAIVIDNSHMTPVEQLDRIYDLALRIIETSSSL